MSGADFDYKFGQKNNWRRWTWNQIADRLTSLSKTPREAIGIYLPSRQNLDESIATSKRFNPHNLIAVEEELEVVIELRRRGVLTVHGSLFDVIRDWPWDRLPLQFIHADLCSCITDEVCEMFTTCVYGLGRDGGALLFNLQRGRETGFFADTFSRISKENGKPIKNRTWALMYEFAIHGMSQRKPTNPDDLVIRVEHFANVTKPEFRSYKSNRVKMDSGVFTLPPGVGEINLRSNGPTSRSIAAILAHRTRRIESGVSSRR